MGLSQPRDRCADPNSDWLLVAGDYTAMAVPGDVQADDVGHDGVAEMAQMITVAGRLGSPA
jgi:hypothetical protein